jgi:hypothetical protein
MEIPSDGRYTKQSRETVERATKGVIIGVKRNHKTTKPQRNNSE